MGGGPQIEEADIGMDRWMDGWMVPDPEWIGTNCTFEISGIREHMDQEDQDFQEHPRCVFREND